MRATRSTVAAFAALALALGLGTLMVVLSLRSDVGSAFDLVAAMAMLIPSAVVGFVIALRRPGHRVGWILLGHACLLGVVLAAPAYAYHDLVAGAGALPGSLGAAVVAEIFPLYLVGLVALAFVFPDGEVIPTARWRRRARIAAGWMIATVALGFLGSDRLSPPLDSIQSPVHAPEVLQILQLPLAAGLLWTLAIAAWALRTRLREAEGVRREQLLWTAWAALGIPVTVAACVADVLLVGNGGTGPLTMVPLTVTLAGIPVAVGIAILRHQLFDIELVIRRTVVYGALTLWVAGAYVALVAGLGGVLSSRGLRGVIAAACVAVAVQPLRDRIQRRVDRWLFAYRREPYEAMRLLGDRLHAPIAPAEVVQAIVDALAEALRADHVTVEFERADGSELAARAGEPTVGSSECIPLRHQGEQVGRLLIGMGPGREITAHDRRLLEDLANQAGVAVRAARLAADLQHSRERLVTAREEERRRVRRDLHDGLGPTLAAAVLGLDAARSAVTRDAAHAEDLLLMLREQLQEAIGDVRRLVYDLRPPALDELGLVGALREHGARLAGMGGPQTAVEGAGPLPLLPAAVEVAAYRIAMEAMNNVTRHAGAGRCTVRLGLREGLEIEITDDGRGIAAERAVGVGLQSMRERARELGGRLDVHGGPDGGTVVRARLPLPAVPA